MTNEQQPADQGRGVGELCKRLRDEAGFSDFAGVQGAGDLMRDAADMLASLTQAKPITDETICRCPEHGSWVAAESVNRLVRQIDVAINGEEGAAKQASLCDVTAQIVSMSAAIAALTQPKGDGDVGPISPNVRAALYFALWHHQGGSSEVGQPIRAMLGMGPHEHMSAEQVASAKEYAAALSLPRQSEAACCYRVIGSHGPYPWKDGPPPAEWKELLFEGEKIELAYTTPQPAQADTTPAAHGVGDGMVPAELVRRYLSAEYAHRYVRLQSPDYIPTRDAWDAARAELQAASAPGGPTREESK